MQKLINGVRVTCIEDIPEPEAMEYAKDEIRLWADKGKELSSIFITLDGEEGVIEAKESD